MTAAEHKQLIIEKFPICKKQVCSACHIEKLSHFFFNGSSRCDICDSAHQRAQKRRYKESYLI